MKPTSLPVVPAQPTLKTYNFSALDLFVNFSPVIVPGEVRPASPRRYDPNRALKTWFDTSPSAGSYSVIVGTNPPEIMPLKREASWCALINLPGAYTYPPYDPSQATTATTGGSPLLNFRSSCAAYADALTLATILNGVNPPLPVAIEESPVEWNTETRRMWFVDAPNGGNYLAEALLLQMWANGIGSPGAWNLLNVANPIWTPAPPIDQYALGIIPSPIRALLPNEVIQAGPLGIGYEIVRTDLP